VARDLRSTFSSRRVVAVVLVPVVLVAVVLVVVALVAMALVAVGWCVGYVGAERVAALSPMWTAAPAVSVAGTRACRTWLTAPTPGWGAPFGFFLGWDFRSQARAFAPERAALQAPRCDGYRDRHDGLRSTTLVDVALDERISGAMSLFD
jgi:hypothetical protein